MLLPQRSPRPSPLRPEHRSKRRGDSRARSGGRQRGARQQRLAESVRPSVCRSRGALPGRGLRGGCAAVRDGPPPRTPQRHEHAKRTPPR
ncbi:hypothetical protein FQA47_016564 [Oryzias melastigma]|uniref:Uncharacterized protein n=1 Tax=Oryzias melastigma TaxID=30732 RepID=A0A834BY91_ORYME|nr:hypothetical protein FQA47_016564 [Oryzias melastigma]